METNDTKKSLTVRQSKGAEMTDKHAVRVLKQAITDRKKFLNLSTND